MSFIDDMRDYSRQSNNSKTSKLTNSIIRDLTLVVINAIKLNLKNEIGYRHVISSKGIVKHFYYQDSFFVGFALSNDYSSNLSYDNDSVAINVISIDDIVQVMCSIINSLSEFSSFSVNGEFRSKDGYKPPINVTASNCSQSVNTLIKHNIKNGGPAVTPSVGFRIHTTITCSKDGTVI